MIIRTETDVRHWLKKTITPRIYWLEAGAGSTVGVPDGFSVEAGTPTFYECKLGTRSPKDPEILRYRVRPAQIKTIRNMLADGCKIWFVVGVKHSSEVVLICANNDTVLGTTRTFVDTTP